MKKILITTIALTAIGVAVRANCEYFVKSNYNPLAGLNVEVSHQGITTRSQQFRC